MASKDLPTTARQGFIALGYHELLEINVAHLMKHHREIEGEVDHYPIYSNPPQRQYTSKLRVLMPLILLFPSG